METGKDFDMFGYDLLAQVQHVTDDCVRLFVLHNASTHVLVAEAHAMSEPSATVQEPAKLVAAYPYIGEHDWRVAYKLALAEAVRQAHKSDDSCPGCGCRPGDGVTKGCTAPTGCGYFADTAADNAPAAPRTEREKLADIAQHVEPRD